MRAGMPDNEYDLICQFIGELINPRNANRKLYISFLKPFAVPDSDLFDFIEEPWNRESAYKFARLANNIPDSLGDWHDTGRLLWNIYTKWLYDFIPAPEYLLPDEKYRLAQARTYCQQHYEMYYMFREPYQNAEIEYLFWKGMPEADRPADYEAQLKKREMQKDNALTDWEIKGNRQLFEEQYEVMIDLGRRSIGYSKTSLWDHLGEALETGIDGQQYYPTTVLPQEFLAENYPWKSYTVYGENLRRFVAATGRAPRLHYFNKAGEPVYLPAAETDVLKVSFDMIAVTIVRDWFIPDGIFGRSWKWSSSTPSDPGGDYPLSDGSTTPRGHLIMYPVEMIFVRNVRIESGNGNFTFQALQHAAPGDAPLYFGPFALDNRTPGNGNERGWRLTEKGIASDELQLAGYACSLLPKSPNPDWALWNE